MFQFSERHIEEFQTQGYTVFQNILPSSLIRDLRRECESATVLAREEAGGDVQRFQPVAKYAENIQPFQDYTELPSIRDALGRVLSPSHEPAGIDTMGVLIEPATSPWCTQWHRDWRDNVEGLDVDEWNRRFQDLDLFNQVNCALYEDSCTWVVPGSHLRFDTDAEVARFPERPIPGPNTKGLDNEAAERLCLDYCYSMPGAQRLFLDAGDYCLYRNSLWHLGNYIPYRRRATLHDGAMTPAFREWFGTQFQVAAERRAAGHTWQNPNADRLAA